MNIFKIDRIKGKKADVDVVMVLIRVVLAAIIIFFALSFYNNVFGGPSKDKATTKSFENLYNIMNSLMQNSELHDSIRITLYIKNDHVFLFFPKNTDQIQCEDKLQSKIKKPADCGYADQCLCDYTLLWKEVSCKKFTTDIPLQAFDINTQKCFGGGPQDSGFVPIIVAKHITTLPTGTLDKKLYVWFDTEQNRLKDALLSKPTCPADGKNICSGQITDTKLTGMDWYPKVLTECQKNQNLKALDASCTLNLNLNTCDVECNHNDFICDPTVISKCGDYTEYTSESGTFTQDYMRKDSPAYWACQNDKLVCNVNPTDGCIPKQAFYNYCQETDNSCIKSLNILMSNPIKDACYVENLGEIWSGYAIKYYEGEVTINNVNKTCTQVINENKFSHTNNIYLWNDKDHTDLTNNKQLIHDCGFYILDEGNINSVILVLTQFYVYTGDKPCTDARNAYMEPAYECEYNQ